jgi:hypothetical protein
MIMVQDYLGHLEGEAMDHEANEVSIGDKNTVNILTFQNK